MEHPDWLLTRVEAVFEAEILDHFAHGPRFAVHELARVLDVDRTLLFSLLVVVEAEALGDRLSTTFHWVTLLGHAILHSRLQLHTFDQSTLESLTSLLQSL